VEVVSIMMAPLGSVGFAFNIMAIEGLVGFEDIVMTTLGIGHCGVYIHCDGHIGPSLRVN